MRRFCICTSLCTFILSLLGEISYSNGQRSIRSPDAGLELGFWYCGSKQIDCELIQWPTPTTVKSVNVKGLHGLNAAMNNKSSQQQQSSIIIFTHGLLENVQDDDVNGRNSTWKFIRNAYKNEGFEHFIFIQWEAVHVRPRRRKILQSKSIMSLAPVIRDRIVDAIMNLVGAGSAGRAPAGADASNLHLIGQNIGAHIMGAVGYEFHARTNTKIGRITGLDPSSSLFLSAALTSTIGNGKRIDSSMILDPSDAEFVDIVHTDSNGLGSLTSFGHVDWYVNGGPGSMQNGCKLPLEEIPFLSELITIGCAHARASALWAYGIDKSVQLEGCPCKKVTGRTNGKSFCKSIGVEPCASSPHPHALHFGEYIPRNARGDYHLHISDALFEQLPSVWYQPEMTQHGV